MVMLWDPRQMKCLPELVHLRIKWDRVCHPLGQLGEASPNFDQKTGVWMWGQRTVCEAWLWVLSGTWVKAEEDDDWVCMIFFGHVTDWYLSPITALPCDYQGLSRPYDLSHLPLPPRS